MKSIKTVLVCSLIAVTSFTLMAGGTDFSSSSGAKTFSLNGMYFAGTDGLQAVLGNPSMLSLLNSGGLEFYIMDRIGEQKYNSIQDDLFKSLSNDEFSFGGGIYWSFSPEFTAALSYQRVVDYKAEWPYVHIFSNDSASSLLAFDFFNELSVDAASASFAVGFDDFSVGAAFNLYRVEQNNSFPRTNERWNTGRGLAGYQFNNRQDGYSFGFNLGASYRVDDNLRIGIMTRSGFKADLEGEAVSNMFAQLDSAESVVNLSGTFEMPWILGGGAVYKWTDDLEINLDLQYSLWGGIQKSFDLLYDNSLWQQNLSSADSLTGINPSSFNLSFDNSFDAGVGIEYKTSDIVLRAGYRFSQSPNTGTTYNMFFPSVDQHWISLGAGYRDENLIIDAAVAYAIGVSTETVNEKIKNLSGTYSSYVILPVITLRYLL